MSQQVQTTMFARSRNRVGGALTLLSFALLVPGLTLPLITLKAHVTLMGRQMEIFHETRSILQTVRNLHESGYDFVAGLILLFGVIVPLVKGALLGAVLLQRDRRWREPVFLFVRSISKWAMADVFVVGVYVSFLSAEAADNLDAVIGSGFYFFVGYCLVSLLALQFMKVGRS